MRDETPSFYASQPCRLASLNIYLTCVSGQPSFIAQIDLPFQMGQESTGAFDNFGASTTLNCSRKMPRALRFSLDDAAGWSRNRRVKGLGIPEPIFVSSSELVAASIFPFPAANQLTQPEKLSSRPAPSTPQPQRCRNDSHFRRVNKPYSLQSLRTLALTVTMRPSIGFAPLPSGSAHSGCPCSSHSNICPRCSIFTRFFGLPNISPSRKKQAIRTPTMGIATRMTSELERTVIPRILSCLAPRQVPEVAIQANLEKIPRWMTYKPAAPESFTSYPRIK